MTVPKSNDGGARSRTRRAILDAAMSVLAEHPAASLTDIAAAADVGRSTLHRYFAERSDLLRALALHVHALSSAAIEHAEPDCGPPVEALRRVVECQLDLGPIVPIIFNEPTIVSDPELVAQLDTGDEVITEVLDRVSTRGSAGPADWPRLVFWALLSAGDEAIRRNHTPRVEVVDAIMASLVEGTIRPDPTASQE
jgi:TetR/AcrR family transcriptional regulator, repressor for lfrA